MLSAVVLEANVVERVFCARARASTETEYDPTLADPEAVATTAASLDAAENEANPTLVESASAAFLRVESLEEREEMVADALSNCAFRVVSCATG